MAYRVTQEAGAETFEFFYGVGGEESQLRVGCDALRGCEIWRSGFGVAVDLTEGSFGCGLGGVDDTDAGWDGGFNQRT
jgi:hypothetical protein